MLRTLAFYSFFHAGGPMPIQSVIMACLSRPAICSTVIIYVLLLFVLYCDLVLKYCDDLLMYIWLVYVSFRRLIMQFDVFTVVKTQNTQLLLRMLPNCIQYVEERIERLRERVFNCRQETVSQESLPYSTT